MKFILAFLLIGISPAMAQSMSGYGMTHDAMEKARLTNKENPHEALVKKCFQDAPWVHRDAYIDACIAKGAK